VNLYSDSSCVRHRMHDTQAAMSNNYASATTNRICSGDSLWTQNSWCCVRINLCLCSGSFTTTYVKLEENCQSKTELFFFCCKFTKRWLIFKILSLTDLAVNL